MRARPAARLAGAFLLLVGGAACVHTTASWHERGGVVRDREREGYSLVSGSTSVLELNRERTVLMPHGYSFDKVYLAIDPSVLQEGRVLAVPSDGVVPYYSQLRAPMYSATQVCTGTVTILRVGPDYLDARLDLRVPGFDWSYDGKVRFRTEPPPTAAP